MIMQMLRAGVLAGTVSLCGCVTALAPAYQPSVANTETLMAHQQSKMAVGQFDAANGVNNTSLNVRGSTMTGGKDGKFSTYLQDALTAELRNAGRYDEGSRTRVHGTLTTNTLSAGMSNVSAKVGAHFVVDRDGAKVFEKSLDTEHQAESSFIGAIAIPAAMENYPATIQQLLGKLFADPDFVRATNSSDGSQQ